MSNTPNQSMSSHTIYAAAMIVHDGGSEEITNFAHLEEFLTDGHTEIHVWHDEHSGDPDTIYKNASVVSITHSTNEKTVDGFDPHSPSRCPVCDGETHSVVEITEQIYSLSRGGEPILREHGASNGPILSVVCTDCHTYLYEHPLNDAFNID